jgi:hypothetical protein
MARRTKQERSMSLLVGCPVILPPRDDVIASWTHRPHMIIVNAPTDDGQHEWAALAPMRDIYNIGWKPAVNCGVARSWNMIFEQAQRTGYSHVALISQGVVLEGGTAHLAELVDEYADERGLLTDFAWHCIVLSVKTWEQLGPFDTTFSPAYYEDSDYVRRLFLAGLHTPDNRMPKVERDLLDGTETVAAAKHLIPPETYGRNASTFELKWGGPPFKETFTIPYEPGSYNTRHNWSSADTDHLGRSK